MTKTETDDGEETGLVRARRKYSKDGRRQMDWWDAQAVRLVEMLRG